MRSARPPFEAPIADEDPREVLDITVQELERDYEEEITAEFERMRFIVEQSIQKRSRINEKISAVSDNTRSDLAFVKGVATMRLLDHYGLYEAYEQATEVPSGPKVHWSFVFSGPGGNGEFTTMYVDDTIQGAKTRTQKLLFCARP